ncbi:hypothetical protein H4R35_000824 [Dimargaris xerosporica]|nr:hypothetical protein H4R35_000824 [Dimargaris xerosporica]
MAWINFVVVSAKAGVEKPHRGMFEQSLAYVEGHPENVLHVGDDVYRDYGGARQLGMHALLLDRSLDPQTLPPAAISSLDQLFDYLK